MLNTSAVDFAFAGQRGVGVRRRVQDPRRLFGLGAVPGRTGWAFGQADDLAIGRA